MKILPLGRTLVRNGWLAARGVPEGIGRAPQPPQASPRRPNQDCGQNHPTAKTGPARVGRLPQPLLPGQLWRWLFFPLGLQLRGVAPHGCRAPFPQPLQVGQQVLRRLVPAGDILGHQLVHNAAHDQREVGTEFGQRLRLLFRVGVLHGDRQCRLARIRRLAGEHVVERHPQRVQVAPLVQLAVADLLGAHVQGRPQGQPFLGQVVPHACQRELRQAKVGDLHVPLLGQQQVLGLDVAVHNPLLVGRRQRTGRLLKQPQALLGIQRPLLLHPLPQIPPGHVLLHQELPPRMLPNQVDRDNIRVVECRGGQRLGLEPLDRPRALQSLAAQQLQRHGPLQAGLLGQVDLGHPPLPQPPQQPELADRLRRNLGPLAGLRALGIAGAGHGVDQWPENTDKSRCHRAPLGASGGRF